MEGELVRSQQVAFSSVSSVLLRPLPPPLLLLLLLLLLSPLPLLPPLCAGSGRTEGGDHCRAARPPSQRLKVSLCCRTEKQAGKVTFS